ncbi:MAG TPA: DNA/RNA non-specific endonuclease [Nevskiales bacterium]|nr:DNA/RNA non-specific endonuclease [Nevskiales bacterium]
MSKTSLHCGLALLCATIMPVTVADTRPENAASAVYGGLPRTQGFALHTWTRVLENRGFTVGYSEWRRNPLWVAYHARPLQRRRPYRRPESFEVDRRTLARVAPQDYARSGYQRGHLAPSWLIAQLYGWQAQRETFLMSNITPQRPGLNQKLWQRLEEAESDRFARWFEGVWVITGPVFGQPLRRLRSGVAIPEAFFRIYVDEDAAGHPRVLAFLVPQDVSGDEALDRFLTTVDVIESRTGLDFLPALEDGLEAQLESAPPDTAHWRLHEICCLPPRY